MECPNCKLINPPTAQRCDCGYDFPSGEMKESYLPSRKLKTNIAGAAWIGSLAAIMLRVFGLLKKEGFNVLDPTLIIAALVFLIGICYWGMSRSRNKSH